MKKIALSLIPFSFLLLSCGTSKKSIKEDKRIDWTLTDSLIIENINNRISSDSIFITLEKETIKTVTYWSQPDSTGTQHKERTEEIRTNETLAYQQNTTETQSDTTTVRNNLNMNYHNQEQTTIREQKDKRFLPVWFWHGVGVILSILIIGILLKIIRK
ncbi:MAG: hypothetical protein LUE98_04475 [Tannerellaceae bacterium]|nr:hypothetical protein [Tannerellaceae bacterium]